MNCAFKQTQRQGIFENFSIAKVSQFLRDLSFKGQFYLDLGERNY